MANENKTSRLLSPGNNTFQALHCLGLQSVTNLNRSGESSRSFFRNLLIVSSMVLPILSLISPSFSLKGNCPLLLSQSSSHLVRLSLESYRSPAEEEEPKRKKYSRYKRGTYSHVIHLFLLTLKGVTYSNPGVPCFPRTPRRTCLCSSLPFSVLLSTGHRPEQNLPSPSPSAAH